MPGLRTHLDSDAYKLADEVRRRVHRIVKQPAFRTDFDLVRQILKSSNSACANIAEGFSRFLPRDHAQFLRIAKASLSETIEHLTDAHGRGLVDREALLTIASFARRSRGACTQWIRYLEGCDRDKT
jgi:four helix bundle protein